MSNGKSEEISYLDSLAGRLRGDINIYQLISPENEEIEKQAFEDHLTRGLEEKAAEHIEGDLSTSEGIPGKVVNTPVLSGISFDRDITPQDLEMLDPWTPEFRYEEPRDYSEEVERLHEARENVKSSDTSEAVQRVYHDTLDEMEALVDIAHNVGNPEVVQDASKRIYGEPSEEVIDWAHETLEDIEPAGPREQVYSATEMGETIEAALSELNLEDWRVKHPEKGVMSVKGADKEILIPESREFTENEMKRLPVHEIAVHALSAANGYEQDYQVLGSGAGGYHAAEEGLAFFIEKETGLADPELEREYAGRVLSVDSVMNGDDLAETYRMNRELGFDHDMSWELATRAHRGGGFIKDHVYAEGYRQVDEYLKEEDGNLEDLMLGKVSVEQGRDLSEEGLEPEYDPRDLLYRLDEITPEEIDASDVDTEALDEYYESLT
ncbi:MAG: tyrosine/phenylalanine carboxypeptidase domain-containing protein [Candidatus Nanosalina sp.]